MINLCSNPYCPLLTAHPGPCAPKDWMVRTTNYKHGDRVSVVFEGTVEHIFADGSVDVMGFDGELYAVYGGSPYSIF